MSGIQRKSVSKSYRGLEVIHGIDLGIAEGSFILFVGPSGFGKSTLLRMMTGLEEISTGEVFIDGVRCNHVLPLPRGPVADAAGQGAEACRRW